MSTVVDNTSQWDSKKDTYGSLASFTEEDMNASKNSCASDGKDNSLEEDVKKRSSKSRRRKTIMSQLQSRQEQQLEQTALASAHSLSANSGLIAIGGNHTLLGSGQQLLANQNLLINPALGGGNPMLVAGQKPYIQLPNGPGPGMMTPFGMLQPGKTFSSPGMGEQDKVALDGNGLLQMAMQDAGISWSAQSTPTSLGSSANSTATSSISQSTCSTATTSAMIQNSAVSLDNGIQANPLQTLASVASNTQNAMVRTSSSVSPGLPSTPLQQVSNSAATSTTQAINPNIPIMSAGQPVYNQMFPGNNSMMNVPMVTGAQSMPMNVMQPGGIPGMGMTINTPQGQIVFLNEHGMPVMQNMPMDPSMMNIQQQNIAAKLNGIQDGKTSKEVTEKQMLNGTVGMQEMNASMALTPQHAQLLAQGGQAAGMCIPTGAAGMLQQAQFQQAQGGALHSQVQQTQLNSQFPGGQQLIQTLSQPGSNQQAVNSQGLILPVSQAGNLLTLNTMPSQPNQLPSALILPNGQIIPVVTQAHQAHQANNQVPGGQIISVNPQMAQPQFPTPQLSIAGGTSNVLPNMYTDANGMMINGCPVPASQMQNPMGLLMTTSSPIMQLSTTTSTATISSHVQPTSSLQSVMSTQVHTKTTASGNGSEVKEGQEAFMNPAVNIQDMGISNQPSNVLKAAASTDHHLNSMDTSERDEPRQALSTGEMLPASANGVQPPGIQSGPNYGPNGSILLTITGPGNAPTTVIVDPVTMQVLGTVPTPASTHPVISSTSASNTPPSTETVLNSGTPSKKNSSKKNQRVLMPKPKISKSKSGTKPDATPESLAENAWNPQPLDTAPSKTKSGGKAKTSTEKSNLSGSTDTAGDVNSNMDTNSADTDILAKAAESIFSSALSDMSPPAIGGFYNPANEDNPLQIDTSAGDADEDHAVHISPPKQLKINEKASDVAEMDVNKLGQESCSSSILETVTEVTAEKLLSPILSPPVVLSPIPSSPIVMATISSPPSKKNRQKSGSGPLESGMQSPARSSAKKSSGKKGNKKATEVETPALVIPESITFTESQLSDVLDQVESLGSVEEPAKKSKSRKSKGGGDGDNESSSSKKRKKSKSKKEPTESVNASSMGILASDIRDLPGMNTPSLVSSSESLMLNSLQGSSSLLNDISKTSEAPSSEPDPYQFPEDSPKMQMNVEETPPLRPLGKRSEVSRYSNLLNNSTASLSVNNVPPLSMNSSISNEQSHNPRNMQNVHHGRRNNSQSGLYGVHQMPPLVTNTGPPPVASTGIGGSTMVNTPVTSVSGIETTDTNGAEHTTETNPNHDTMISKKDTTFSSPSSISSALMTCRNKAPPLSQPTNASGYHMPAPSPTSRPSPRNRQQPPQQNQPQQQQACPNTSPKAANRSRQNSASSIVSGDNSVATPSSGHSSLSPSYSSPGQLTYPAESLFNSPPEKTSNPSGKSHDSLSSSGQQNKSSGPSRNASEKSSSSKSRSSIYSADNFVSRSENSQGEKRSLPGCRGDAFSSSQLSMNNFMNRGPLPNDSNPEGFNFANIALNLPVSGSFSDSLCAPSTTTSFSFSLSSSSSSGPVQSRDFSPHHPLPFYPLLPGVSQQQSNPSQNMNTESDIQNSQTPMNLTPFGLDMNRPVENHPHNPLHSSMPGRSSSQERMTSPHVPPPPQNMFRFNMNDGSQRDMSTFAEPGRSNLQLPMEKDNLEHSAGQNSQKRLSEINPPSGMNLQVRAPDNRPVDQQPPQVNINPPAGMPSYFSPNSYGNTSQSLNTPPLRHPPLDNSRQGISTGQFEPNFGESSPSGFIPPQSFGNQRFDENPLTFPLESGASRPLSHVNVPAVAAPVEGRKSSQPATSRKSTKNSQSSQQQHRPVSITSTNSQSKITAPTHGSRPTPPQQSPHSTGPIQAPSQPVQPPAPARQPKQTSRKSSKKSKQSFTGDIDTNLSHSIFENSRSRTPFFPLGSLSPQPGRSLPPDGPAFMPGNLFVPGGPRPLSNSGANAHKNADLSAQFNTLFPQTRSNQNPIGLNFQPPGFGMNPMHSGHSTAPQITPHSGSISVTPHLSNFTFSNILTDVNSMSQNDALNISPIKFPHGNSILPPQPGMDPNPLQHPHHLSYHGRTHQSPHQHVLNNAMSINSLLGHNPHGFDGRPMPQGINSSMAPPFHGHGHPSSFTVPTLNFAMHDQ